MILNKLIGQGSYGKVYSGVWNGKDVAIKQIPLQKAHYSSNWVNDMLDREYSNWKLLSDYPHISKLYDFKKDGSHAYFISELCSHDIRSVFKELNYESRREIIRQCVQGVYWCHHHNIVHSDIKMENVMKSYDDDWKLIDFGNSHFCLSEIEGLTPKRGTIFYMSPEIFESPTEYGRNVDIWAIGILTFAIYSYGHHAYCNNQVNWMQLKSLAKEIRWELINIDYKTSELIDFIDICLQMDKSKRASIKELIDHDFIKT